MGFYHLELIVVFPSGEIREELLGEREGPESGRDVGVGSTGAQEPSHNWSQAAFILEMSLEMVMGN